MKFMLLVIIYFLSIFTYAYGRIGDYRKLAVITRPPVHIWYIVLFVFCEIDEWKNVDKKD